MLCRTDKTSYEKYIGRIDRDSCGAIYPFSVAENIQQGDIFTDGDAVLFRHFCGFAHIYGIRGNDLLESVYKEILSAGSKPGERFILFVQEEDMLSFFRTKDDVVIENRLFFEYPGNTAPPVRELPSGLCMREIDEELTGRLNGRITPHFSWDDMSGFVRYGKGYCVTDGESAAAWAFSAAVSSEEIDIGIETDGRYRQVGLATACAEEMIRYILSIGKRPVWACHAGNEASHRLAEKLGFVKVSECFTVRKA